MAPTTHYEEVQYFRQPWLWTLLIISGVPAILLGIVSILSEADAGTTVPMWIGFVLAVVFGLFILLYRANLRIEARDNDLTLRLWPFHLRARTIPYKDIDSITITEISPITDFGGGGVRFRPSFYRRGTRFDGPVGYIVDGKQAIRIVRAGEKSLVVTSIDPDTLVRTIERVSTIGG